MILLYHLKRQRMAKISFYQKFCFFVFMLIWKEEVIFFLLILFLCFVHLHTKQSNLSTLMCIIHCLNLLQHQLFFAYIIFQFDILHFTKFYSWIPSYPFFQKILICAQILPKFWLVYSLRIQLEIFLNNL
jgi:hypothetical protein